MNCGRWDYIFSCIKKFRNRPACLLPDRAQVTMTTHSCGRTHGCSSKPAIAAEGIAIGGMAAQIPIKNDPVANEQATAKVRADKQREVGDGHDGTWVAPGPGGRGDGSVRCRNARPQPARRRRHLDLNVTAADLLSVPEGPITPEGLRTNVAVGVRYSKVGSAAMAACRSST